MHQANLLVRRPRNRAEGDNSKSLKFGAPVRIKLRTRMLLKLRSNRPPCKCGVEVCIVARHAAKEFRGGVRIRFGSEAENFRTSNCCPLCPRKRTSSDTTGMSALCQKRTNALQQIGTGLSTTLEVFG